MKNFIRRSKLMLLLMALFIPCSAKSFSSLNAVGVFFEIGYSCLVNWIILADAATENEADKALLNAYGVEKYSLDDQNYFRKILGVYISDNKLVEDIVSCIRKPKVKSEDLNAYCSGKMIIFDLLLFREHKVTDTEIAYVLLHEYGHKINKHALASGTLKEALKIVSLYGLLILLRDQCLSHIVKNDHFLIHLPLTVAKTYISIRYTQAFVAACKNLLQQKEEFRADDYAFKMLKKDSVAGVNVLNRTVSDPFQSDLFIKPPFKVRLRTFLYYRHPMDYDRYQHACKVARKYGWTPEAAPKGA